MAILYDDLPNHPKVQKAGELIGGRKANGAARALALYVSGLCYARKWFTDGFLPSHFIDEFLHDSRPELVANALSSRQVRLWHKQRGGFRINDYHDVNPTAEKDKHRKELARARKRRQREREHQEQELPGIGSHAVTQFVTRDILGKKKEVRSKNSTGTSGHEPRTADLPTSTDSGIKNAAGPLTPPHVLAFRRHASKGTDTGQPKFTVIRALARAVLAEHPDLEDDGDLEAIVMGRCAREANLLYTSAIVKRAVEQARAQLRRRA